MTAVTRRLEIDAGHRLLRHEGKCANVHGHRYAFEIEIEAPRLDDVGRVVDFGVVKRDVGGWLDLHLDHAFVFQNGDPLGEQLLREGQRAYCMGEPPTAENLARLVFGVSVTVLPPGLRVLAVTCYETPNCWARYAP